MKKALVGIFLTTFAVGMFAFAVEAQHHGGRGRGRGRPTKVVEAPQSAEIANSLGDIHWGMTKDEVLNYFLNQIRERYRPLVAKARDSIEEDRLRQQLSGELRRIHDSVVDFNGQRTGWDISYLRDEFTHNNGESMLQVNDENAQNFYFFINNHLWKWFKAFNADAFPGHTFTQFAQAIQGRFGHAVERHGELVPDGGDRHWLEWQDSTTRLRAVDQTQFYGFYCLVFESKETVAQLPTLRRNVAKRTNGTNAFVTAVTSDDGAPETNPNADIIDRITGKIHQDPNAANPPPGAVTKGRPGTPAGASARPSPGPANDDPLTGAI